MLNNVSLNFSAFRMNAAPKAVSFKGDDRKGDTEKVSQEIFNLIRKAAGENRQAAELLLIFTIDLLKENPDVTAGEIAENLSLRRIT